ncbi:MAG: CHASE4 domain-containing protein [Steroidobacteraceae bacterium]
MQLRAKVIAVLSACFLALILLQWGVGQGLLMPQFERIELDNANTAMMRIDSGLQAELAELHVSAADWGNWSDAYKFMEDPADGFIQKSLNPSALKQLNATALAFVNQQGEFVWTGAINPDTAAPTDLDLFQAAGLPEHFPWRANLVTGVSSEGLIATNRGVMLAAITPILDGFGHGPAHGALLLGRLLTHNEVAAIGARAHTQVTLIAVRYPGRQLPGLVATENGPGVLVTPFETTQISRQVRDIFGEPVITLRIEVSREVAVRAHTTLMWVLALTALAAIIILVLAFYGMERTVLGPLDRVTRHAVAIGAGDDLTNRLNLNRRDEIGALAAEFDRMVEQVAESRRQLIDHSFEAGMSELSRGVLHNIGNAMTPLSVRLARLKSRLQAAPQADVERALSERTLESNDRARQSDLDEFLRLAAGELADIVSQAAEDVAVIERQAGIVQAALSEQLRSTRTSTVVESTELPALIGQSLEIVPDAARERIDLELDPSIQSLGAIRLPRTVLRLVLQNLIINASEAIRAAGRERGSVRLTAALHEANNRQNLELACHDNGCGIAPENLERVFERGFSTKRGSGNLGIGLHWCATAVNALGGRMWASSAGPEQGAILHLLLPVPRSTSASDSAPASDAQAA